MDEIVSGYRVVLNQVLTGTLTLFQAARERRCHVQRPGIEPGCLNLEARNLPLDQNAPLEYCYRYSSCDHVRHVIGGPKILV